MYHLAELPPSERPRERLKRLGGDALRAEELIAILLGSGSRREPVLELAHKLLVRFESIKGIGEAALEELQSMHGIGLAKALKLKAAFSLVKRSLLENEEDAVPIRSPQGAFKLARPYIEQEKRELFLALLLNSQSRLIRIETISIGTLSATLVHPREVLYQAIRRKASSWIAVHNHPSGELLPSKEDLRLTETLAKASSLVDIPLLDHLIVSTQGYYSLKEHGFVFSSHL